MHQIGKVYDRHDVDKKRIHVSINERDLRQIIVALDIAIPHLCGEGIVRVAADLREEFRDLLISEFE